MNKVKIIVSTVIFKAVVYLFKYYSDRKDPFTYLAGKVLCIKESEVLESQHMLFKAGFIRAFYNESIQNFRTIDTGNYRWVQIGEILDKDDEWYESEHGERLKTLVPGTVCDKKSFYRRKI